MRMLCESDRLEDYLDEVEEINFSDSAIQEKVAELFNPSQSEIAKVKRAFEYVRDEISHSWDIQSTRVTCTASEVLKFKEGICYAKANLLAALLRSQGIPTGFCYQRLMLFDAPEKGYCIHALNAVFLSTINKWIRLDARGNKEGINATFSTDKEQLAFTPNRKFTEIDYPFIYRKPHPKTMSALKKHTNILDIYRNLLPEQL